MAEKWGYIFFPGSIRQALFGLAMGIMVPLLVVNVILYNNNFKNILKDEYRTNLEVAHIVALGFEQFIHDIQGQELAIGKGILFFHQFDKASKTRYLIENKQAFPSVLFFGWVEPDGTISLSSWQKTVGLNIRNRKYYQNIVNGSDREVSDLLYPLIGEDWVVMIARGIRDEEKRLLGIVIAAIDPNIVGKRAFSVKPFEGGAVTIFDSKGIAIFRIPNVPLTHALRVEMGRRIPGLKSVLAGEEYTGSVISAISEERNIASVVPIRDIGWAVSASRSEAMAFRKIRKDMMYNLLMVVGVGLLSLSVGYFTARGIAYQINRLKEYAIAIGHGAKPEAIKGRLIAELGEVAGAMCYMARQLEERESAVQQAAEEATRRAEELDAVFDSIGQGIVIYDENGRFMRVNKAVRKMIGFDLATINDPRNLYERINLRTADGKPARMDNLPYIRALHGESTVEERYYFRNLRNEEVVSQISSTPLYLSGKIVGVVTVWQDVTERERLHNELQKSEEKYRELVQNANSIILRLDQEGRITFFNEYARKFFGFTEEEILGQPSIGTIVPSVDSNGRDMKMMIYDLLHHPELYVNNENENICRDGRRVWIVWNNHPIYDEEGRFKELLSVGIDATDRKRVETALRESESRFRRLAEMSTFGLIIGTNTGEITYTNPAATRILGYTQDEFQRSKINLMNLTVEEYRELDRKAMEEREAKGYFTPFETVCFTKDGGTVPILLGGADLEKKADGSSVVAMFLMDMTQLKEAQNALRNAYDELEVRVQERTAELQRSNEELARFTYIASHDLQEPLRMVSSYTQLLEMRYKDKLDAEANQYIAFAIEGSDRMRELIKAILEYSQITTLAKPFRPTDLERVVEKAIQSLKIIIDESQARITRGLLPTVCVDESQFVQVFKHLIENAIKFRREDAIPEIHIEAQKKDLEWLFSIKDNGIGIEKQYYDQIFAIFKRLHGRQKYRGVGVGLAVVKRIIERHKGIVYLESQPGVGTTFYFTLPVEDAERKARR
jgi:PAS domain S-box-containing protein